MVPDGETGEPVDIDWPAVWRAVAARIGAHGVAGRGHLLTEDTVRFETVLDLGARGVPAGRLAAEVLVPVLAGGKLDLVVDPPAGTVIEFKYPRDSRTGFSPDTMTFGELLRDFLRVAAVSANDRWVVQVLNARLLRYLIGVCRRHGFRWVDEPGDTLELHPASVAALPKTATQAIGAAAATATVTARCIVAERVNPQLGLYAYRVDGLRIDGSADGEPMLDAKPVVARTAPPRAVAVATRNGARREILEAARAIVTRTGRNAFTMPDVITEMRRRGTGYAEATIRTMMSSHMCAEAAGVGVAGYADLSRIDRATYRLTSWEPT